MRWLIFLLFINGALAINATGQVAISSAGSFYTPPNPDDPQLRVLQGVGSISTFCAERVDNTTYRYTKNLGGNPSGGYTDTFTDNNINHSTPSASSGNYKTDAYYDFIVPYDSNPSFFYVKAAYDQSNCAGFNGLNISVYNYSSLSWDYKYSNTSCYPFYAYFPLSDDYVAKEDNFETLPSNGKLVEYRFDGGSFKDYSSYGRDGTNYGSTIDAGKYNEGINLTNNGYAQTPSFSVGPSNGGVSIAFWLYYVRTSYNSQRGVFGDGTDIRMNDGFAGGSTFFIVQVWGTAPSGYGFFGSTGWYHIAFTYDGTTGSAKIYRNGALYNSFNPGTNKIGTTQAKTLGRMWSGSSYWYNGLDMIDDFKMYNYVLNSTDITNIYQHSINITSVKGDMIVRYNTSDSNSGGALRVDYQYVSSTVNNCAITSNPGMRVSGEAGISCASYNSTSGSELSVFTSAGFADCARTPQNPLYNESISWLPQTPLAPCSPTLYYIAPDYNSNYLCCNKPDMCAINGRCAASGNFEGDYCCYGKSRFELCYQEGTTKWKTPVKNSVCYADPIDNDKSNDCSVSQGCRIDNVMSATPGYPSQLDACLNSPTSIKNCEDGACDEDNDVYYCCDGARCDTARCDVDNLWIFDYYNVSVQSPANASVVYRSTCQSPNNLLLDANVSDTLSIIEGNVNINTTESVCSHTGSSGNYVCDYDALNNITPGFYLWNISYWRGNETFKAVANRTVEVRGCLSGNITNPVDGFDVYRSTCSTPSSTNLQVNVTDENAANIAQASLTLNLNSTGESCSFSDIGSGIHSCTYDPSNSLSVGYYNWNASVSKQFYYSNVSNNKSIEVWGCGNVTYTLPANNSWFDRSETINFNASILLDNSSLFPGHVIDALITKNGTFESWFVSDNGTYDSPGNNGYYNHPYNVSLSENYLGNWIITYTPQPINYYTFYTNSSNHRVDDIVVSVNYTGDAQFLFIQGNASYYSGVELLNCANCINLTLTDARGVPHYYLTSVVNNYFSHSISDQPLRAGSNSLTAFADYNGINGTSNTLSLVVSAKITFYDSDSNACLDGGNGQDINYTVSVQNNGTVSLPGVSVTLQDYNSSNVLLHSNQTSESAISPGQTVNYTAYYNLSSAEPSGLYGLRFFASDPMINNGIDVVSETNTSAQYTGMRLFNVWRINGVVDLPGAGADLNAGEPHSFNVSANVDTGASQNSLTTYCSDNLCAYVSINLAGGAQQYFSNMVETGSVFNATYTPDTCQSFTYDMNLTEKTVCGLNYTLKRNFDVTCNIFVDDFSVITSDEVNHVAPSNLEVVDKGVQQVSFQATIRDALNISELQYVWIEIRDENNVNVGTWINNVANLDDPEWTFIDTASAKWTRTWNVNDITCGKYSVYVFVNNTAGQNDTKNYEFVLDKLVSSATAPDKVVVGSNYTIQGSVTSCSKQDNALNQINLSNVNASLEYVDDVGVVSTFETSVSADGSFSLSLTAPDKNLKLLTNTTNVTFRSLQYPGCTVDCDSITVQPLSFEFVKTELTISPLTKVFAAGTPGDKAYTFTVRNPSNVKQDYSLEITSDEIGAPAAFSGESSPYLNISLAPGELYVGSVDLITALSGVYAKSLNLQSAGFPSDNSSIGFEARINTEIRSVIFTYNIIPGLDLFSVFVLFLFSIVIFLRVRETD